MDMAVKLHRCSYVFAKLGPHPCWRVQKALDEQGIEYEIVKGPFFGKREEHVKKTGQRAYPAIEFEDGTIYREESADDGEDDPRRRTRLEAQRRPLQPEHRYNLSFAGL